MKYSRTLTIAMSIVVSITLVVPYANRSLAQQNQSQQLQLTSQQVRQLTARGREIRSVSRMIGEKNPGFESHLLFTKHWRTRLAASLNRFPEMRVNRNRLTQDLNGVEIANELTLPEQINLTGDTVILARNVRFQGRDVRIKGPHSLHIFAVDSIRTDEPGGSVTIDTSGSGRKEWLEAERSSRSAGFNGRAHQPFAFLNVKYDFRLLDNGSGENGADGASGQGGVGGSNGSDGSNGVNGSCFGYLGGSRGNNGTDGTDGGDGESGGNGANGADGQTITLDVGSPVGTTTYSLISKGGDGGYGGRGGDGGYGGIGGNGGNGGSGATCNSCKSLGNGGDGGDGGNGGNGGSAGRGGDGGNGGNGGNIVINYPGGFDWNRITIDNSGGAAGQAGQGGVAGQGGRAGTNGNGGSPGSLVSCAASPGIGGGAGDTGNPGATSGGGGNGGGGGAAGAVSWNHTDGGGGMLEPGGTGTGGCTEWYLVTYNWNFDTGHYEQVSSYYAGCW